MGPIRAVAEEYHLLGDGSIEQDIHGNDDPQAQSEDESERAAPSDFGTVLKVLGQNFDDIQSARARPIDLE